MASVVDPINKLTQNTIGGLKVETVSTTTSNLNMIVYGDPGVGKTLLAGSAADVAEMAPVLFIDVEGGTLSLRNTHPYIEVVRVKTWEDMQNLYNELHRGKTPYRTVVLDSLTEIQKFSLMRIMVDLVREHDDRDPDVPGMREWGKNIEQIRKMVRAFRDLEMNTIFTALAQYDKDQRTGMLLTKPSLPGKLAAEIPGFVDIVLYMYVKNVDGEQKRLMLSQKTDSVQAKDRSGMLSPVIENPTMSKLYSTLT